MTQSPESPQRMASSQKNLLAFFLEWYWVDRPSEIVEGYFKYAGALWESFSIPFMLKTLVSPWKSITDGYPAKGFNIEAIVQTFFLNMTSRIIGLIVRTLAIIAGIVIQILLLAASLMYAITWLFFPVAILASIPILFGILLS